MGQTVPVAQLAESDPPEQHPATPGAGRAASWPSGDVPVRGVPLKDRPVTAAPTPNAVPDARLGTSGASGSARRRACLVTGPREDPGPFEGMVLRWERGADGTWRAWAVYAIPVPGPGLRDAGGVGTVASTADAVLAAAWIPAAQLQPLPFPDQP